MAGSALLAIAENDTVRSTPVTSATPPYLFADSEPFSYEFDCISTVSGLVELAAVVLAEARAAKDIRAATDAASMTFTNQLTRLSELEREIARCAPQILLSGDDDAGLAGVSTQLNEVVRNLCGSTRERLDADLRRQRLEADARLASRHQTARSAVQHFLLNYELAVSSQRFEVELCAHGYNVQLTQALAGGIDLDFRLQEAHTAFSTPRRLSDLAGPLRVPVGQKRALLSQALVDDSRSLGDYLLTRLRLEGDVLELELRKKREAPDALRLHLVRYNDGVTGQIVHSEEPDRSFDVPLEHAPKLVPIFQALQAACCPTRETFAQVTDLRIDGENALEAPERFLDRLLELFEPIVSQLMAHGAATSELSLKRDLGDGRREERFVSLAHLVDKVSALSHEDRARLSRLGLDQGYRCSQAGAISSPGADHK